MILTTNSNKTWMKIHDDILHSLIKSGHLSEVLPETAPEAKEVYNELVEYRRTEPSEPQGAPEISRYIEMHLPIEQVIEKIAKDYLGVCEDRKAWKDGLKTAVGEYGHDEVIVGFQNWCENQNTRYNRPVTVFLKNVGQYVSIISKPLVTNPVLEKVERKIALMTDNKVVFVGTYRIQLAALLRQEGAELTVKAFEEVYKNLEEKQIPWAAREFLQRAPVIIWTIKEKDRQKNEQEKSIAQAYQQAKTMITEIEEEDEEL